MVTEHITPCKDLLINPHVFFLVCAKGSWLPLAGSFGALGGGGGGGGFLNGDYGHDYEMNGPQTHSQAADGQR